MSGDGRIKRTSCAACLASCRVLPTEIAWWEGRGGKHGWLFASRDLCPPCRRAQKDFWFRPARPVARGVQLRLLSDVEAPLRLLDAGERRLTRHDLEDLAAIAAAERRSRRTAG